MTLVSWVHPFVLNFILIVKSVVESPNVVLFKAMIDKNVIWVWWIGVKRFSLNIIEFKDFITVLSDCDWGDSDNILLFSLTLLKSLEIISLMHWDVIHITQERRVLLETFVPSQEWVIKPRFCLEAINHIF